MHSDGEWKAHKVRESDLYIVMTQGREPYCDNSRDYEIGLFYEPNAKENAELSAAAPAMLKALRSIADYMDKGIPLDKLRFGDAANYASYILKGLHLEE